MSKTVNARLKVRNNTAANFASANPVLLPGEIGYETDTGRFKVGDGTTTWNSLSYSVDSYFYGHNTVTTLASLPVSKRVILATVSAATTLSLAATLADGKELFVKLINGTASAITQPLPTSAPFSSKKNDGTNITSVTLPASGMLEISILSLNGTYYIKTDA